MKAIVPPAGQADILTEHHDNRMAGHFGMEKTLSRLRQSPYFWPKMRATVEDWCRKCGVCARTKATNRKMKAPMQSVGAGVTLERVGIDILGPLPETHQGNRFILVVGGLLDEMDGGVPNTQSHGIYGGLRPRVSVHVTVWDSPADPLGSGTGNSRGHFSGKCVISCRLTRPGPRLGGPVVTGWWRTLIGPWVPC